MIFVTLGSQKFQFNRLLKAVDELIDRKEIQEEVFAQIGYSDYEPRNYKYEKFLNRNEFAEKISNAETVITHGGTGAIINAVKAGKKVIAVPRRAMYGEHVDDHQLQVIKQFEDLNLICVCNDCEEINVALSDIKLKKFETYKSNTNSIIMHIEEYIEMIIEEKSGGVVK